MGVWATPTLWQLSITLLPVIQKHFYVKQCSCFRSVDAEG